MKADNCLFYGELLIAKNENVKRQCKNEGRELFILFYGELLIAKNENVNMIMNHLPEMVKAKEYFILKTVFQINYRNGLLNFGAFVFLDLQRHTLNSGVPRRVCASTSEIYAVT